MTIEILQGDGAVAEAAAQRVAAAARDAVATRGRFSLAVSGGHTPWQMLSALAAEPLPWASVHLFQVDERVAPAGDPDRNLTHIKESLLSKVNLPVENLHAMPVLDPDLPAAAAGYAGEIATIAGKPPVIDVVHLGLGPDGHTASLVPGDPVLDVVGRDVAITRVYSGRVRMTLTYPVLNRARAVLWLVTGAEKAPMLPRLLAGDHSIPAGRVRAELATVLADRAAAAKLGSVAEG
jgi:6-phosphogluconolactonase